MPLFPLLLATIVGSTGCASLMPADDQPPAATQAEVAYLRSEIHRLQARLDASDAELGRVDHGRPISWRLRVDSQGWRLPGRPLWSPRAA